MNYTILKFPQWVETYLKRTNMREQSPSKHKCSGKIYISKYFSCLQQLFLHPVKDLTLTGYEAKIERPGISQGLKSTDNFCHIQILCWALGMLV